jgi:2-keto-3-deoxy-L-rhamnonate aldolase RhmA
VFHFATITPEKGTIFKGGRHMWSAIRSRVLKGEVVYGIMVRQGRDPGVTTLVGKAGFDFVFIDMEHGAYSLETVADLIRGAKSVGCAPIIRVPAAERYFISRILDAGAEGIMVPMTSTREQAERIVSYAKFPPMGERGVGLANAQVDFAAVKASDFTAEANERTLIIAQIENREGIRNIDQILSVEGIDLAVMGPNDLSYDLGYGGEPDHPKVVAAIQKVVDACQRCGKHSGTHMGSLEQLFYWKSKGMTFIAYNTDSGLLYKAASDGLKALRQDA